ncbi:MAG: ArsR/SmtB family transcription factor, partial [Planctomycetota bacterium]
MTGSMDMLGWMQTLSDQTRTRLLRLVDRHELTVAELCAVVQLPQSTVSRHLKVLAGDGWVDSRREGTSRLYHMTGDTLGASAVKLWQLLRQQTDTDPSVRSDERRLEKVLADRQTRSQAFFSSEAGRWDKLREELYGQRFDLLGLLALLDEAWTVGDLGCGTGQV